MKTLRLFVVLALLALPLLAAQSSCLSPSQPKELLLCEEGGQGTAPPNTCK